MEDETMVVTEGAESSGDRAAQAEKRSKKPGLRSKEYGALFRAGLNPERVPFTVQGRPAWVDLLPMGHDARDGFLSKYGMAFGGGVQPGAPISDAGVALVSGTVVDFLLWEQPRVRGGELGEWQQRSAPEDPKQILHAIKQMADALPEWWDDLMYECAVINRFTTPEAEEEKRDADSPN